MARRPGELSTGTAARLLEVDVRTVRRWAQAALEGTAPARFERARRDLVGRYWVAASDVRRLLNREDAEDRMF